MRRVRHLLKRKWDFTENGNPCLRTDNFTLVVFPRGSEWSGLIVDRLTGLKRFGRRTWPSANAAKLATLAGMLRMKNERGSE